MHKAIRLALAATILTPLAAAPAAQADNVASFRIDTKRIDTSLAEMVSGGRAAGVSALVWQGGRERYYGQFGFADREAKRGMSRDTLVNIFSMTKPVTGVALMTLWEQGKFGLDDPVARYIPEFADARFYAGNDANGVAMYKPATRPVLIRDLMRHTAGVPYGFTQTPPDILWRSTQPLSLDNDLETAAKMIGGLPLTFDPGTQWSYSSGVDVQARLVEIFSGMKFADYVAKTIFQPLGMKDSAWAQQADKLPRFAASYTKTTTGLARVPDEQARALSWAGKKMTMGGAGICTTIDDYMRFARMLLGKGTLDGVRILKPSTIRLMSTDQLDARVTQRLWLPGKGNVGFGLDFAVRVGQPKDAKENRGAVGEFFWDGAASTLFWVDPANDLAAVFFVQVFPFDGTLHHDFRTAVYGADYLGPAGD
ncbi:beta-lactamase family protein [Sphingomonas sp. LB-2]|uniref:serine hydrolase domain-containing protein n=1 Tax=Sphingomonas caeni TaxID=2984949 RepID=UPI00222F12BD|nr:serine hydrolase domain-containing protein [Sphingomonas caeni]MCW3847460.1 beta-lactamase family protein [Sphingomonas caeni]